MASFPAGRLLDLVRSRSANASHASLFGGRRNRVAVAAGEFFGPNGASAVGADTPGVTAMKRWRRGSIASGGSHSVAWLRDVLATLSRHSTR
jgi:hypothetical protein